MKIKSVAKGFTLIELLVVVLIIGILSAVALPMYRQAVERSRVADALSTMDAVAKSEHGWYLTNNSYTKDFGNLDIDLTDANGNKADNASFETANYTFTLQDRSIKVERNNGEYTLYKSYEDGNIYCLPESHYICEQYFGVNGNVCNNKLSGFWSNLKDNCYGSNQERCADNGEYGATWKGSYCGYSGNINGVKVTEFQECRSSNNGCQNSTFTGEGAKCTGERCSDSEYHNGAICDAGRCNNSTFTANAVCYGHGNTCKNGNFSNSKCIAIGSEDCQGSSFSDGAECISSNGGNGCRNVTVKSGSKCVADSGEYAACNSINGTAVFEQGSICVGNVRNTCRNTSNFEGICVANKQGTCANSYTGDGCCCGDFCGSNPKCVDKGITCPDL